MSNLNGAVMYAYWGHLSNRDIRMLGYMAVVANDYPPRDMPPEQYLPAYWGGWYALATLGMGRKLPPENEMDDEAKDFEQKYVDSIISSLKRAGAIVPGERTVRAGKRAVYGLTLDPNRTARPIGRRPKDKGGQIIWEHVPREPYVYVDPFSGPSKQRTSDPSSQRTLDPSLQRTLGPSSQRTLGISKEITKEYGKDKGETQAIKSPAALDPNDVTDDLARDLLGQLSDLGIGLLREVDDRYPELSGSDAARRIKAAEIHRERIKRKRVTA